MNFQTLYILDLEYLSWNLRSAKNLSLRKKSQPPEIIQMGIVKLNFKNFKIRKILNIYISPKINKKIPKRIVKLTSITNKIIIKKGITFESAIKNFIKFISNKSVIICNGHDDKIIKINLKINNLNLKLIEKKFFFSDLSKILKSLFSSNNLDTENLLNLFKIKRKIISHNALNDCKIIKTILIKISKKIGRKKLINKIFSNAKKFN